MAAIVGYLISLMLSMMGTAGLFSLAHFGINNVKTAATAQQLAIINKAAQQYVQDNAASLAAIASATTSVSVTPSMLSAAGYLPANFGATNPFGQTWLVQVLQPSAGKLQTLVTSQGGVAISDTKQLVQIAAQAGAQGGFVPYANQAGQAFNTNNAYGSYGGWNVPLTGYTNPGSGHLASLLSFANAQTNNSYLYRVSVPGQPQLNNMQTDLGLTDTGGVAHNITGVAQITAGTFQTTGGGTLNSDQGGSLELGGNNGKAGGGTPYIDFHLAGQGVQDFNARLVNDTNGKLSLTAANGQGSLSVQGTVKVGNVAYPRQSCSGQAGSMAANVDGSGQILECRYGQWMPLGGQQLFQNFYVVQHGTWVPAPTCPSGGTPQMQLLPSSFYVDPTAVVNFGPSGGSGPWVVYITDGQGSPVGGQAIAETFCAY
jgi:hypothetical protein